jgi:hypothetical protein
MSLWEINVIPVLRVGSAGTIQVQTNRTVAETPNDQQCVNVTGMDKKRELRCFVFFSDGLAV